MTLSIKKKERNIYDYFYNVYEKFDINTDDETINLSYNKYTNLIPGLTVSIYHGYFDDIINFFEQRTPFYIVRKEKLNSVEYITDNNMYYNNPNSYFFRSVKIEGYIRFKYDGYYKFYMGSDDGAYLYIKENKNSNINIINVSNGGVHDMNTAHGSDYIYLNQNKLYYFILYYGNNYGLAGLYVNLYYKQRLSDYEIFLGTDYTGLVYSTPNNNYDSLSIVKTNINIKPFYIIYYFYNYKYDNRFIYYTFSNTNNNSYNYLIPRLSKFSFIKKEKIGYYETNKNVFKFNYPSTEFIQNINMYFFDIKILSFDIIIQNIPYDTFKYYFNNDNKLADYIIIDFRININYTKIEDDKSINYTSVKLFVEEGTNNFIFSEKAITETNFT